MSKPGRRRKSSARTNGPPLSRRRLLAGAAGLAGGIALGRVASAQAPPTPPDTTRVPGLPAGALGAPSPFESASRFARGHAAFAPLDRSQGVLTPASLHFVVARDGAGIPEVDPRTYRLMIHGMVARPKVFALGELQRLPSESRVHFVECSGNSVNAWFRPEESDTAQNVHGLTSTSEWTGVPLSTLLTEVGASREATWMLAESQDSAVYARSIPSVKAWDDILVAWGQNGEALRPEQGYPIRLIVPGWEGSINVKWLRRIELSDRPFMTRDETATYTDVMPDGTALQFTFKMGVKSVITIPSGGHRLPGKGFWEVTGIAWSGGGGIVSVEVSTDGGATWAEALVQEPALPRAHTRFRFPWEWDGGEAVLMSRATDEDGNVQPTLDALIAERGLHSIYHNNAIQAWKVNRNGNVVSTHEPFPGVASRSGLLRDSHMLDFPGCLV